MKVFRSTLFLFISILFISCSDDDASDVVVVDGNIVILEEENRLLIEPSNAPVKEFISITDISINKRRNTSSQVIIDGSPGEIRTYTNYHYDTQGNLISRRSGADEFPNYNYFYLDNTLIGYNFHINEASTNNYRIVKINETKFYFERLTLPFDDPNTEMASRIILEFDTNDNIIKVGQDYLDDLDGNYNDFRLFSYSADNNLTSITTSEDENLSIEYTQVIDTEAFIRRQTFSKKNLGLHNAERFALSPLQTIAQNSDSFHVPQTEFNESEFETNSQGFYIKKSKSQVINGNPYTETRTYTFQ